MKKNLVEEWMSKVQKGCKSLVWKPIVNGKVAKCKEN